MIFSSFYFKNETVFIARHIEDHIIVARNPQSGRNALCIDMGLFTLRLFHRHDRKSVHAGRYQSRRTIGDMQSHRIGYCSQIFLRPDALRQNNRGKPEPKPLFALRGNDAVLVFIRIIQARFISETGMIENALSL